MESSTINTSAGATSEPKGQFILAQSPRKAVAALPRAAPAAALPRRRRAATSKTS